MSTQQAGPAPGRGVRLVAARTSVDRKTNQRGVLLLLLMLMLFQVLK